MHWPLHPASSLDSASNPNRPLVQHWIEREQLGLGWWTIWMVPAKLPFLFWASKGDAWAAARSCEGPLVSLCACITPFWRVNHTMRRGRHERRSRPEENSLLKGGPPFQDSLSNRNETRNRDARGELVHVATPTLRLVSLREEVQGGRWMPSAVVSKHEKTHRFTETSTWRSQRAPRQAVRCAMLAARIGGLSHIPPEAVG